MNENKFWQLIAVAIFVSNTFGILILLEMFFLKKPFLSLFLIIFILTLAKNFKKTSLNKPLK